jgi:alkylhydroperoxidase family enzyme
VDEHTEDQRELVGGLALPAANIFATLVRHPGLFRKWMPFGGKLLSGKIPARERELLILRTGWTCRSEYEWAQHVLIGRAAGLGDDEIERVKAGPDDPAWDEFDATLLRAADELHTDSCLTDATWAALTERYDEKQMIELPMLVGQYHLVAMTLNSLGVQREEGMKGFDP